MVVYRSKMTHGRNKSNFKVFDALEFIAGITQHIPSLFSVHFRHPYLI